MELPAEPQLRWLLRTSAALLALGAEPVRGLILPTPEFFPDVFDGSPKALAALLRRVATHVGLPELAAELVVVSPEGEATSVSCASGSCCSTPQGLAGGLERVQRRDDGSYAIMVATGEAGQPDVLVTILVRALAQIFLLEVDGFAGVHPKQRDAVTDLAAVLLGFGVLVSNGSHVAQKGCGGVKIHSATTMATADLGVALGIFCVLHEIPERLAEKHLSPTPRAHFTEGHAWASANARIVRQLRDAHFDADRVTFSAARGWFSRLFSRGKGSAAAGDELAELEQVAQSSLVNIRAKGPVDPEKARRLAELRELVDESLER